MEEARRWYRKAADGGDKDALAALELLGKGQASGVKNAGEKSGRETKKRTKKAASKGAAKPQKTEAGKKKKGVRSPSAP
jgi:TPR repeat protein